MLSFSTSGQLYALHNDHTRKPHQLYSNRRGLGFALPGGYNYFFTLSRIYSASQPASYVGRETNGQVSPKPRLGNLSYGHSVFGAIRVS